MQTKQRRRFERVSARFPVWLKRDETGTCLQGHSANVSAGGMYLMMSADCDMPLGSEVTVVFGVRNEDHGGYDLHEPARGAEIVRMERHGYGTGIAVKFTEPRFTRCEQDPLLA
jgi:c-di-GMP-binding flagellar brake protein YcgR